MPPPSPVASIPNISALPTGSTPLPIEPSKSLPSIPPQHQRQAPPLADHFSRLVQRPKNFSGKRSRHDQPLDVHSWLNKLEMYFKVIVLPREQWTRMAFLFLDPPAFDTMKSSKKMLQRHHEWHNNWDQFTSLMLRHYVDPEVDFAIRTRLQNLTVLNGNVLTYARIFNALASKLVSQPLGDEALISMFMQGLDKQTFNNVIIDPSTGLIWKSYNRLHDYVVSKYSCMKYHANKNTMIQPSSTSDRRLNFKRPPPFRTPTFNNFRPFKRFRPDNDRPRRRQFPPSQRHDRRPMNRKSRFSRPPPYQGLDIQKMRIGQRLSLQQKEMLTKKGLCFFCFKPNHTIETCAAKNSVNSQLKSQGVACPMVKITRPRFDNTDRMLCHKYFERIQLMTRPFTLDACANSNGDNALCPHYCSPDNSFLNYDCSGHHVWCNPPYSSHLVRQMIIHYKNCKARSPYTTSACFMLPSHAQNNLHNLLNGMTLLLVFPKFTQIVTVPRGDGTRMFLAPGLPFDLHVYYDPPKLQPSSSRHPEEPHQVIA